MISYGYTGNQKSQCRFAVHPRDAWTARLPEGCVRVIQRLGYQEPAMRLEYVDPTGTVVVAILPGYSYWTGRGVPRSYMEAHRFVFHAADNTPWFIEIARYPVRSNKKKES